MSTRMASRDLLTAYMGSDYSALYRDAEQRPAHYADLQDFIDRLRRNEPVPTQLRSEILQRYVATTRPVPPAVRRKVAEMTDPDVEPPVFEEQSAGPTIKLA